LSERSKPEKGALVWWYARVCITAIRVVLIVSVVLDLLGAPHRVQWPTDLKHALISGGGIGVTLALILRPRSNRTAAGKPDASSTKPEQPNL